MQAHFMTEWSQASCSAVRLECSGGWNVAESREAAEAGMRREQGSSGGWNARRAGMYRRLKCAESRNVARWNEAAICPLSKSPTITIGLHIALLSIVRRVGAAPTGSIP